MSNQVSPTKITLALRTELFSSLQNYVIENGVWIYISRFYL